MSRKIFIILAIIVQLAILTSFVVRYEILKSTGTTVYVPLRGYDPTDIFRWDYVNLSYELPYSGSVDRDIDSYSERLYASIDIDNRSVVSLSSISRVEPTSGLFFQVRNGSSNQKQAYTILTASGKTLPYEASDCMDYQIGQQISYYSWDKDNTISNIYEDVSEEGKLGKIVTKWACSGTYRFQTTATDRFFVREKTGLALEEAIREWDLYGVWKVSDNGAVIITDIISKKELPK